MIVAATGHRPNKLFGYNTPNPMYSWLFERTKQSLIELKPSKAISGMALGFDQLFADVCIELGIPFIAAVPFIGQEKIWPQSSKNKFYALLKKAASVEIVSEGDYAPYKLQVRNVWMVDHCDVVLACFDGTSGGTKNCVEYAKTKGKTIVRIDPREFESRS